MIQNLMSVLLTVALASVAVAASTKRQPNSKTNPMKVLNCALEYKKTGSLVFENASERSGNWILGEETTVTLKDLQKLSVVTLESAEKSGKDFYRLRISQNNQELVNTVSDWRGLQVTLPIHVKGAGSEDPPTFDQMRVTCEIAIKAG